MDSACKREKKAAYREREVVGGIYAIRNTASGKLLLQSTADMAGSRNRFAFSQQTGSCVSMKLQRDWAVYGKAAFVWEILEELVKKETQTEGEFSEDLRALKALWEEKFDPAVLY
jgi:hypothetical protein